MDKPNLTPVELAIAEFQQTIADLGIRLWNQAGIIAVLKNENDALKKKIAELEKPPS